jgi:hypothetical protein
MKYQGMPLYEASSRDEGDDEAVEMLRKSNELIGGIDTLLKRVGQDERFKNTVAEETRQEAAQKKRA